MPSFQDSIFLFILALLLFGPKRLPQLAREVGKWLAEFRRASNEFKMQMEDELRAHEHAEQQKKIAAMEAAAPPAALPAGEPEHPHIDPPLAAAEEEEGEPHPGVAVNPAGDDLSPGEAAAELPPAPAPEPLPIAESGDFRMMPPATGLPRPRGRNGVEPHPAAEESHEGFGTLIESISEAPDPDALPHQEAAHGR
jgi:sec-independent protein translocase protein TatB